ncbi:MAG: hypothetical protein VKL42_17785 [Snowella sp.]|nr:hypothetical protein [Snowella sp.]
MSEELSNYDQDSDHFAKVPNTELIYKYTESLLKNQSESLNRLDTKLSAFLAFTGVLVRFVDDLSGKVTVNGFPCHSCTLLKLLAYISLGTSAFLLCLGLTTKLRGSVISPKTLMRDEWYFADSSDISDYIVSAWIEAEKEYEQLGFDKSRKLNMAVRLIALALVSITVSALIQTIWGD